MARRDFMFGKTVRGGCFNTTMSGRTMGGTALLSSTPQLAENVYGVLDPLGIDPYLVGKMVALYVIPTKTAAQWTVDASLNQSGGSGKERRRAEVSQQSGGGPV